jgi:hypothetical protein
MTDEKQKTINSEEPKKRKSASTLLRSMRKKLERPKSQIEEATPKKQFWVQIRLLPIWLRIILVLALLTGAAILGVIIGYGTLGGGNPVDVFKKETWTHMLDIINGKVL